MDVVVVAVAAESAGALETADLLRSGVAKRAAIVADPPDLSEAEFLRRGLAYENAAVRVLRQLRMETGWSNDLRVRIQVVDGHEGGKTGEGTRGMKPGPCRR